MGRCKNPLLVFNSIKEQYMWTEIKIVIVVYLHYK